jgi:hypothetical protein
VKFIVVFLARLSLDYHNLTLFTHANLLSVLRYPELR